MGEKKITKKERGKERASHGSRSSTPEQKLIAKERGGKTAAFLSGKGKDEENQQRNRKRVLGILARSSSNKREVIKNDLGNMIAGSGDS